MNKAAAFFCFAACVACIGACDPGNATGNTADKKPGSSAGYDTLKIGRETFEEKCTVCHGSDGRLGLSDAGILPDTKLSLEEIKQQVTNGKKGMPSFRQVLTEDEIMAVAKYALSLKEAGK